MDSAHRTELKEWLAKLPDLAAAFGRLDINGDGLVSRTELQSLVDFGVLSSAAANAMLYMGDTDGDGQISLDEFVQLGGVLQESSRLKAELGLAEVEKLREMRDFAAFEDWIGGGGGLDPEEEEEVFEDLWEDLSEEEQASATHLGWDEETWGQHTEKTRTPWDDLSDEDREAAEALGYDQETWEDPEEFVDPDAEEEEEGEGEEGDDEKLSYEDAQR